MTVLYDWLICKFCGYKFAMIKYGSGGRGMGKLPVHASQ